MTDTAIIDLAVHTMLITAKLCVPILLTSLAIGFGIGLLQSVTQIQEVTLTFVPKMVGVGLAVLFCGKWMLHEITTFATQLFDQIPALLSQA